MITCTYTSSTCTASNDYNMYIDTVNYDQTLDIT